MAVKWVKDPDSVLDYTLDWSDWLAPEDAVVHATFTPDSGLGVLSVNTTDKYATGWLTGGIVGQTYSVTCHITTDHGRQDDRTFQIVVKET